MCPGAFFQSVRQLDRIVNNGIFFRFFYLGKLEIYV